MHDDSSEQRDGDGASNDERTTRLSRRRVLASTAAGAGALALGLSNPASAAKVEEVCNSNYGKIEVADEFTLIDNRWGMDGAEQCVWLNDDGSYGYDFDASNTSGGINYPEVFIGTRPWGDDTGVAEFPIQRRDVDEFVMEVDADYTQSGGEWDWAEEWWLMEQPPGQQTETHQYEVMLLLDWNDQHDHGALEAESAWTDQFGNTVDHWTTYNSGGTDATFFIFRIQGGHDGGRIDLKEVVDYLTAEHGIAGDLWLSGVELGNEYWGGASGQTTYNTFDVTINGSTYTSGSSGGGTETPTDTDTPTETDTPAETDTPTETDTQPSDDRIAEMNPSTTSANVGERITFQVEDTSGSGRWITELEWTFGDGTSGTGWWQSHSYDSAGSYTVALTATANTGETTTHEVTIDVS